MERANDVEVAEGKEARAEFKRRYHLEREAAESRRQNDVLALRRELLDAGMDPHTDIDTERQVYLLEHGIDLERISGTPQNERMIKNFHTSLGARWPTSRHAGSIRWSTSPIRT